MHTTSLLRVTAGLAIVIAELATGAGITIADIDGAVAPTTAPPVTAPAVVAPAVVLDELSPELERSARWAIELFDAAGMELPPVHISSHGDDTTACNGAEGIHRPDGERSIIEMCTEHVGFATDRVMLHELAHAWERHNVTPTQRVAFQLLRGNDVWHDYDAAPWHENGIEQAAEIVLWGVIDRPAPMIRITQNSCAELDSAFRLLTGFAPLPSAHDRCDGAR